MHLLHSIVVIGFAFIAVLGARSFVRDLLALTKQRPPSVFDAMREDDQESEDQKRRPLGRSLLTVRAAPVAIAKSSRKDHAEV